MGNFSKAVSEILNEAERRSDDLKKEIKSLKFQKENSFQSPSKEWVNHRIKNQIFIRLLMVRRNSNPCPFR